MRALQTLHEGFGRNFAAGLSAMLRSMVEVKLTSVDQLTYSEFIFSLENPDLLQTCLRPNRSKATLILDINPSILYPIIDRLLGGGRERNRAGAPPPHRNRAPARLAHHQPCSSTNSATPGKTSSISTSRSSASKAIRSWPRSSPPNEVVVLISFELAIGDVRGMMNLCIPYNSIERISGKLSANSWVTYGRRDATPETIESITQNLRGSLVAIDARLATTRNHRRRAAGTPRRRHHHHRQRHPQPPAGHRRGRPQIPRQPGRLQEPQGHSRSSTSSMILRMPSATDRPVASRRTGLDVAETGRAPRREKAPLPGNRQSGLKSAFSPTP